MAKPYKLKDEIGQFIVEKKGEDPKFSCRKMVSLIKERFGVELSKSTINAIIKENSLSNKVGRPRVRPKKVIEPLSIDPVQGSAPEPIPEKAPESKIRIISEPVFEAINFVSGSPGIPLEEEIPLYAATPKKQSLEIRLIEGQGLGIENGGAIFLLMADYKSGLTDFLAQKFLTFMPDLSRDTIRLLIQSRVYGRIIKDQKHLGIFLGKELIGEYLGFYHEQIAKVPLGQLNPDFTSLGLARNINEINMLYKECLLCLNQQAQELFLPSIYQFLDFSAMCERFYSLIARITKKDAVIAVQFFYPKSFKAIHDLVWQEDFKSAVSALNKERIFTPEGKLFRFEDLLAAER
jgi:hypothetical protein